MTQVQKYTDKPSWTDFRSTLQNIFLTYISKHSEVFEALSRQVAPFGGNLLEKGYYVKGEMWDRAKKQILPEDQNQEVSENRFSVLYTIHAQYHHVGCSSQAEAQYVMSMLMTDENRIPIGIYDEKTNSFEWEMIGQYFHSKDPVSEQQSRHDKIMTIARALRRRDSSWQPGYLQRPGFFA